MIDLENYLYDVIRPIFDSWNEDGIYAVSFFVCSNELHEYRGFSNVTNFSVSYNTETDCRGAGRHSEARWNYAFWRQNDTPIFDSYSGTPETDVLFDWYAQQGITNIGYETGDMEAPVGFQELTDVLSRVARRFQEEGYFVKKFGRSIPILIHDLEYIPCTFEATAYANPNGEAADFLAGNWETASSDWNNPMFEKIDSHMDAFLEAAFSNPEVKTLMNHIIESQGKDYMEYMQDMNAVLQIILGDGNKK